MGDKPAEWLHEMPNQPGVYVVACNARFDLGYVHQFIADDRLAWLVPAVSKQWHHYPATGPSGWWWWSEPIRLAPVPDWHAPKNTTEVSA